MSRMMKRILIAVASLLLIIVLTLALLIYYSEDIVRSVTKSQGSKHLDRELTIDGALDIQWRWRDTRVHAENIRLTNASGYDGDTMASIATLDFTFNPSKLLIGKLEFGDITVVQPYLSLQRLSEDEANWNFPFMSKANVATEAVTPDNRFEFPVIGKLTLTDGEFVYRDAVLALDLDLTLDTVIGDGGDGDADNADAADVNDPNGFSVAGSGSLQQQPFDIEASGASLETLRDTAIPFPLRVLLTMGATRVQVQGTFQDPTQLTGIDASLHVSGDTLSDLFYLTAIPLPPTPRYSLEGQLTKEGDVWGYQDFRGLVGDSDLSGDLSYDTSGTRGYLQANLHSTVLDSGDLGGFIGLPPPEDVATEEQKAAIAEREASARLIPDVPLTLDRLRATDLDITLDAEKIDAPAIPIRGMNVRFLLEDGLLTLDPLQIDLADGSVDGRIQVDAKPEVPPMSVNLNLRKLSLAQFFEETRFAESTDGLFGGKVELSGTGASLAEVLADSNGNVSIIMTQGTISLLLVEAADLDIAQAIPLFLGRDRATDIHCGVMDFTVTDGELESNIIMIDTKDSRIVGDVSIDLKDERIEARLKPRAKDFSPFSAQTPITVSGQLKEPSVGIDAGRAGTRVLAAAALGSLLTPLAALIPFIETGGAGDADCRALLTEAHAD
jgi:uncharacterized protein involved in outer membrane biogenesis